MLKKTILPAFLFLAGASNLTAVYAATTWDATNDFTPETTTNPNGVWSYGYNPASVAGYQFKAFDLFSTTTPGNGNGYGSPNPTWLDSTYISLTTPSFAKIVTALPMYGIQPGQITLHPGPVANGDEAILRFTAPATSSYNITAQFFAGDISETDAWIIKNSEFTSPLSSLGVTSSNPVFSVSTLLLAEGDTLDFVVGNHGSYFSDSTPLSVQISAVPLPAPVYLFGTGVITLALLGAIKRKSKPATA